MRLRSLCVCSACSVHTRLLYCLVVFFDKQKTAYEMRMSDWSSDVCSSDLRFRSKRQRQLFQRLVPQRIDCCESGALRMATGLLDGGVTGHGCPFCPQYIIHDKKDKGGLSIEGDGRTL